MSIAPRQSSAVERRQETSSLADVVSTILDKGIVIDVFARVSVVGIELVRIDARVVVASVDTYLRFAEAANRLQLGTEEPGQLTDVVGDITQKGGQGIAQGKAKGAIDAGIDKLGEILAPNDGEDDLEMPRRSRRNRAKSRRR